LLPAIAGRSLACVLPESRIFFFKIEALDKIYRRRPAGSALGVHIFAIEVSLCPLISEDTILRATRVRTKRPFLAGH
jgi:hypothetical protein